MKNRIIYLVSAICLGLAFWGMLLLSTPNTPKIILPAEEVGSCGNPLGENIRVATGVIDWQNEENPHFIRFWTEDGNTWNYDTFEVLSEAGYYCLFFDTKGTPEIFDDEIIKIFRETC